MSSAIRSASERHAAAVAIITPALLLPAFFNRFPLIFPDSGTYLGIAARPEYALDRSSFYGFLLKPVMLTFPTLAGLWLTLAAQCLLIAISIWFVARAVSRDDVPAGLATGLTIWLTSLPWHSAQFMPDAFTGPTILVTWLAVRRDPAADGSLLLWLIVGLFASLHYTHIPLMLATAGAVLLAEKSIGLPWWDVARRGAATGATLAVLVIVQVSLNGAIIGRATLTPAGPVFLYARLNEDGLIAPWLADHCGRDAPPRLCALAPSMPHGSQMLLWGGKNSPVPALVWEAPAATRWSLVDEMEIANRGAILDRPGRFLGNAMWGTLRQFGTFQTLDDECPSNCRATSGGIGHELERDRPTAFAAFATSRQYLGTMPKSVIRSITMPVAIGGLLALPFVLWTAWRRRDSAALGLASAVTVALVANAALAGALSDVHGRYQSRLVWLAPFVVALLFARWRRGGSAPLETSAS